MTRRIFLLLVPLAVLALLAAGCGGGGKKSSSGSPSTKCTAKLTGDAVATVCNATITRAEFADVLNQAKGSYKVQKRPFPTTGSPAYQTLVGKVMDFLVQRSEFEQESVAFGVKVTDKQVADRLAEIKKQYFGGSKKRYEASLKQQGVTDAEVRADIHAQLVSDGLYKKVTAGVKIADKDVSDYYQQHLLDQYTQPAHTQPASRDVRHILVKDKSLADRLYRQLQGGADFAALAKKNTLDTGSKATGGKLTISTGQTVPPFDKVAFALKTKEISKPVHSQYGWHIIQALSDIKPEKKIPKKVTPFSQVKSTIRAQLLSEKQKNTMAAWVDKTTKEFATEIHYAQGYTPPSTPATTTSAPPTTTG
jgi:foldase protein PrsA